MLAKDAGETLHPFSLLPITYAAYKTGGGFVAKRLQAKQQTKRVARCIPIPPIPMGRDLCLPFPAFLLKVG